MQICSLIFGFVSTFFWIILIMVFHLARNELIDKSSRISPCLTLDLTSVGLVLNLIRELQGLPMIWHELLKYVTFFSGKWVNFTNL